MKNLMLIYFKGCPNYEPAIELLKKTKIPFQIVCQDELDSTDPLKGYASPSLIHDQEIIFGSTVVGGGCTVKLPDLEELKSQLELL